MATKKMLLKHFFGRNLKFIFQTKRLGKFTKNLDLKLSYILAKFHQFFNTSFFEKNMERVHLHKKILLQMNIC
jgi:hypothetical protein